jgi:hypothetical protein
MHDHTASRILEDSTFSSERQERDIERVGSQEITSDTRQTEGRDRLLQLSAPSNETPYQGSGFAVAPLAPSSGAVSQITTKSQSVKHTNFWSIPKPLDWILTAFKPPKTSPEKPADGILPLFTSNENPRHLEIRQGNPSTNSNRYLYLCVNSHSTPRFTEIDCTGMTNDHDFFKKLKSSYDSTRGHLHLLLSIRQYHYCEFYLFGKWGIDMGGPLKKHSFPAQGDPSYDFTPRPPFENLPCGPITPQEFCDRYYRSDIKSWKLSLASSSNTTAAINIQVDCALKSMPLRTAALDWKNGKTEDFYGLLAVEQLCYRRLKLYLALVGVLLSSSGLSLYVLRGRGMEDLQNALKPLQVALAAWPIVVNLFS